MMINSVVRKSETSIAHPVTLRVQPLTIDEALARGLDIPMAQGLNLTNNTGQLVRIPIKAKGKHELTSSSKITFLHSYM